MFGAPKTPFGGGAFGTSTSAFGAQQATPFGSSSGGLFGNTTPSAGAFGTPGFGTTTPASGGLFGGTSAGSSLFGAKTTQSSTGFGFGGTGTSSTGLFGNTGSSLFQTTPQTSNAFGQKATGFTGFGGSKSAFGSTAGSMFGGGTSSSTGLFGGTSAFGQPTSGTTVKFVPVASTETTQKSGIQVHVKTQNQCITIMDTYKDKSVEELRLEDYAAGRKGSTSTGFGPTGGLFGSSGAGTGSSIFSNSAAKPGGFGSAFGTTSSGGLFGNTSSGGLFGAKTTASLFGSTTSTSTGFGGFGGTTSGGLFGSTPATGFGATTAQPSGGLFGNTGSLFGGTSSAFGSTSQGSSLFSSAAKPSIGFGATGTGGFGTTGAFGSTAPSGGLFGGATSKPGFSFGSATTGFGATTNSGGLFGGTSTGGLFGNKTTGFGSTGFGTSTGTTGSLFGGSALGTGTTGFTGFGSNQSTGLGGTSLGGLSNVDQSTLAALRQQQMVQQQLKAIANTPFGDSPLFRNLMDSSKKTTSANAVGFPSKEPMNTSQYKVFSRPAAKVKPRPISSPSLGKSRLFDGLEDEGDFSPHALAPRRSVKKLVIKNKLQQEVELPFEESQLKLRSFNENDDDDLIAPSPEVIKTKSIDAINESQMSTDRTKHPSMFDNTITELNVNEITPILKKQSKNYTLTPLTRSTEKNIGEEPNMNESEYEVPNCGVILKRSEYYSKPSLSSLDDQVNDGQCLVRDFVVGRDGYGEVKFLGITNIYNLDLDKIVFFRRREVEVYPDNYENKPEVGQELNKPAEITLLKVWPNDKSSHTPVKTPERLKASGFIDRIEEKTLAMDAVFIDYRPNEGAWVFKVNHFTRYGIQEQYIGDGISIERRKRILREKNDADVDFQKDDGEDIHVLTKEEVKMKLRQKIAQMESTREAAEQDSQTEEEESEMEAGEDSELVESFNNESNMEDVEEDFMPLSHQLGRIAHVQPFNLQGMKTSILYDDEEDVATPKTMLRSKRLFSNKSIFGSSFIDKRQSTYPKLDTSKSAPSMQDTLNSSVFQNLTSGRLADVLGSSMKVQKKSHLFKSDIFSQNSFAQDEPTITTDISRPVDMFIKCRTYGLVPYEQSLLFGKTSLLADASLVHGREFNVGWMNKLTFVHSGDQIGTTTDRTQKLVPNIFKSNFTHSNSTFGLIDNNIHVEIFQSPPNEGITKYMEECLFISLKHTDFEPGVNHTLGILKIKSAVAAITDYAEISKGFKQGTVGENSAELKLQSCVWDLVSSLWGQQDTNDSAYMYEVHSLRKEAFSKWLSAAVADDVKAEVEANKVKDDGHLAVIFSLLSGNQIQAACDVARDNEEIRLAFLLAQISGDHHLKQYIRNQLSQWEERSIDEFIHAGRLKLYTLLSGMMVWKSTNNEINLCKEISWKRSLALHLWYYCSTTASIFDAFSEYQSSFKGTDSYDAYSVHPSPDYLEADSDIKDICYHVLALYCKRSHSLERMLTPKTHTSNPLDYHLSWHLHQVLEELGYNHMTDERHSFLQHEYASQLESLGLWHWSIFVLMHLRDDARREHSVKNILNRYCQTNEEEEVEFKFSEEEELIVNEFHVPVRWLHEAKALHCKYTGQHYEEAVHLVRAGQWNKAHVVILNHLAADAIIEEEYDSLKNILEDICTPERCCTIKNWRTGGLVFLDYILLNEKLENIRANKQFMSSYHLEDMEAEIASLINRISLMKVENARERLCQSEMARTCSNMLKIVFSLLNTNEDEDIEENPKWSSVKVVPYVVELPLPPDYYLKELRELLANFTNEIENMDDS